MSVSNSLPNVLAALPANPAKAAAPAEQANEGQPPFAAVLQQKISHSDKPSQPSALPVSPKDKPSQAVNDAATSLESAPALATAPTAETLLPWLNGLPTEVVPTAATPVAALPLAAAQDAPSTDTLSLMSSQDTTAGLLQAAQAQVLANATPQAADGLKTAVPQEKGSLPKTALPQIQLGTETKGNLAQQTANESANLAAETLSPEAKQAQQHSSAAEPAASDFANVLSLAQTEKAPAASAAPAQANINASVGSQAWPKEMGEHLVWMSNRQESRAELTLNPPHMGKIEVSLNINGDQASVSFVSANPQVRDALESAMNRLRETLAENGINLGQSNVGAESSGTWAQQQQNNGNNNRGLGTDMSFGGSDEVQQTSLSAWQGRSNNSMLDVFA